MTISLKESGTISSPAETLKEAVPVEQLEAMSRNLTFADALRVGVQVTEQEYGWGSGDRACALSAVRIGGEATGWVK